MLRVEGIRLTRPGFSLTADLSMPAGSRTAVIGPSGGGKSTLLSVIAGFETPDQGRIVIDGRDMTGVPPGKRPVAMLFQDGNLFPHLTATRNVALGLRPNGRLSAAEEDQVRVALDRVGLASKGDSKPAELSGGQQSRVALARVLVQRRALLLLDEPFAALGPALKAEMLDLVAELVTETGSTLMMVSHDPEDARRISDQVILVADGVAHPPMATPELLDNPPPALKAYLG